MESGNLAYPNMTNTQTGQLEVVIDALKAMGYSAVGVGPTDLRFGDSFYKVMNDKSMPVVNLGAPEAAGAKPFIIRDLSGVKVGVVSFGTLPDGAIDDYKLLKERYEVYAEARQKSDVLIVLDQGKVASDAWIEKITKRYGAPDIILGGTGNMILVEPKMVGETMIVPTSVQGNAIAQVDIEINGATKKKTYKRVGIDESCPEDADVLKMVKDFQAPRIVNISPGSTPGPITTETHVSTPKEGYYSYQTCMSCHKAEYDQWKTTKHATALTTLEKQNKTLPECLPCHSEMYRRIERSVKGTDGLGGVECMSCHADVLPHGAGHKAKHETKGIREACKDCHTPEHSPHFVPNVYLGMVKHK